MLNSTPKSDNFPTCDFCVLSGSYMRRDFSGMKHRACGNHSHLLQAKVDHANDLDIDKPEGLGL